MWKQTFFFYSFFTFLYSCVCLCHSFYLSINFIPFLSFLFILYCHCCSFIFNLISILFILMPFLLVQISVCCCFAVHSFYRSYLVGGIKKFEKFKCAHIYFVKFLLKNTLKWTKKKRNIFSGFNVVKTVFEKQKKERNTCTKL